MSDQAPLRSLGELATLLSARLVGDSKLSISGVAPLETAGPNQVAFFHNGRYRAAFAATRAGAVLVAPAEAASAQRPSANLLVSENPYLAFGRLSQLFHPRPVARAGRHPSAVVDPSARVAASAEIGPLCYVGAGASIGARTALRPGVIVEAGAAVGEDCLLHAAAVVRERCVLGDRVILQPGAVVGSDGFGYAFDGSQPAHVKVPQAGIARLEDDVELGANACVDRATLGETLVGRGTKIDNLVQIAHNVRTGVHCLLCAQAGIAGSTQLGDGVVLGGQAGLIGHATIGDGVKVGAQGGVISDIPAGESYAGYPARPLAAWLRGTAAFYRAAEVQKELLRRVAELEAKIEQ